MGFDIELIREALKNTTNDMQKAIENLLRMQSDGSYQNALQDVLKNLPASSDPNAPSTSTAIQNMEDEMQVSFLCEYSSYRDCDLSNSTYYHRFQAYDRFAEDIELEDNAYLDLPLTEERALLDEYRRMLNM